MRIGVVVPAYQADRTLASVVQRLQGIPLPWRHLWIVDDGSRDRTLSVAHDLAGLVAGEIGGPTVPQVNASVPIGDEDGGG